MASTPDTSIIMDQTASPATVLPDELVRLPEPETWREEERFSQQRRLPAYERSFGLFNGRYLEVCETRRKRLRRSVFNLAFLDPKPVARRRIAWRWLSTAAVALAVAATCLYLGLWLPGAGVLAAGLLATLQGVSRSWSRLIFCTRTGRAPAFAIDVGPLQARRGRKFAAMLSERIGEAASLLPATRERLALEMAEHRRLRESETLSGAAYEQARKRILARFNHLGRAAC